MFIIGNSSGQHLDGNNSQVVQAAGPQLTNLPQDIITKILMDLDLQDISTCSLVCRTLNIIAHHEDLWGRLYSRDLQAHYPTLDCSPKFYETCKNHYPYHLGLKKGIYSEKIFIDQSDLPNRNQNGVSNWNSFAASDGKFYSTTVKGGLKVWDMGPRGFTDPEERLKGLGALVALMDGNFCFHTLMAEVGYHTDEITCFTIADGTLFSGSKDRTIWAWDAKTGYPLNCLAGHTDEIWSLLAHEGKLFSGGSDNVIRVWDANVAWIMRTWKRPVALSILAGHTGAVFCLAARGEKLFSGSNDGTVRAWDIKSGACLYTLLGHTEEVLSLAIHNKKLFSGSRDGDIITWDIETGKSLSTTKSVNKIPIFALAVVNGMLFYSRAWGIGIQNIEEKWSLPVIPAHTDTIISLSVVNGKLFSSCIDGIIKVWDFGAHSGEILLEIAAQLEKNNQDVNVKMDKVKATECEKARMRFSGMTKKAKDKIYGELYDTLKPWENDYWGCAEDAFHDEYEFALLAATQKARTIKNYVTKHNPPPVNLVPPIVSGREAHKWDAVFCNIL